MALSDRFNDTPQPQTGLPCSVAQLFDALEGDELAHFERMMYGAPGLRETTPPLRGWSQARIWKAVTDEGHWIGSQTINRHRGKNCRCYNKRAAA